MRKLLFLIILIGIGGTGFWWMDKNEDRPQQKYRTQKVEYGLITQSISANGTLNPVTLVLVGSQISGTVQKIHINYNDIVKEGQVLAELDPALLKAQVKQSEAKLLNAQATLKLAQSVLKRTRNLFEKKLISEADLESAQEKLSVAEADVRSAAALLEKDKTSLQYMTIRSPISGTVISKSVEVGQTVAASLQAPTLFQIAQDLKNMQIETSVSEADVGLLKLGQEIKFRVDAFPDKNIKGIIHQIRLNPTIQQNVVTYNVIVMVNNEDGLLLPGMTAHVTITVNEKENVLRIPNSALNFKPKKGDDEKEEKSVKKVEKKSMVYILKDEQLVPIKLVTGITDNMMTEVVEGDLKEGDLVVTKELKDRKSNSSSFRFRMM
jgi:HlyD family secretion protein